MYLYLLKRYKCKVQLTGNLAFHLKKISKTLIGCFKFIFKFKLDLVFSENNVCSRLL